MKRYFLLLFTLIMFLGTFLPSFASEYVPGEIVVKLKPSTLFKGSTPPNYLQGEIKSIGHAPDLKVEKLFPETAMQSMVSGSQNTLQDIYKVSIPKEQDILPVIEKLQRDPNVLYAEPNYLVHSCLTPNDPYLSQQWGITKIAAENGWGIYSGSSTEIIAVVDTGVSYIHEDLTGGKVLLGHDYVNGDDDPTDDNGHGTHISGIAGAITDNNKGIAGINWLAKILAIKVLDSTGHGSTVNVALGVREAADRPAGIINLSLGETTASSVLEDACTYAYNKGCVIVAAAGNSGSSSPFYPAAYTNVIAVAATDQSDKRAVWGGESSNYGTWVDISAPGTDIYSTTYNSPTSYGLKSGTSMAAPFVSGLAALIKGQHPTWGQAEITAKIQTTADNIDSLNPGYEGKLGSGRINVGNALGGFLAYIATPSRNSAINGTVPIRGYATGEGFTSYKVEYLYGATTEGSWIQIGTTHTSPVGNGLLETWSTIPNKNGIYTLKLTVSASIELTHTINVTLNNSAAIVGESLGGPNPFSPKSGGNYTIYYQLATDATVSIYIFDITGNLLWKRTESQSSGPNYVLWDGKNAAGEYFQNGAYLYRIVYESGGTQTLLGKGKVLILN
ncbi:MAG: S8 family serine peptidase [Candidatus Saganbacteria bacterium]|nr:S8 family serine peptidase [Candidatus Saganbacteria bacterium]